MQTHRPGGRSSRSTLRRSILAALASLCCVSCRAVDSSDGGIATTSAALRQVRPGTSVAVNLQGVITYADQELGVLFVQDSTGASRIERTPSASDLVPGDHVAVSGRTSFSPNTTLPIVSNATFTKLAPTEPPLPQFVYLAELRTDVCDGRRVETAGTIAAATRWSGQLRIEVASGSDRLEVRVLDYPLIQLSGLVGARVTVRGVCMPSPGVEAKVADFRLIVSRFPELGLSDDTRAAIELSGSRPLLTDANTLRNLSPEAAARHHPVHISGVVTYVDQQWQMLFVQDSTGGVYVDAQGSLDMSAGDLVDVQGWSDPGNYAPEITRPTIKRLGRGALPSARAVSIEQLLTGKEDSQWTEIRAVVRGVSRLSANQLLVQLAAGHSRFAAVIPDFKDPVLPNLIDAVVRVSGVSGTLFNQRRQLIGIQHYVPSLDYVRVESPGPRDLFASPVTAIGQLTQFTVDAEDAQRVRLTGVVTLRRAGSFFVKDATGSVEILLAAPQIAPGDEVEVVGFTRPGDYSAVIDDPLVQIRRPRNTAAAGADISGTGVEREFRRGARPHACARRRPCERRRPAAAA